MPLTVHRTVSGEGVTLDHSLGCVLMLLIGRFELEGF